MKLQLAVLGVVVLAAVAVAGAFGGSAEPLAPAGASATTATHTLTVELVQVVRNADSSSSLHSREASTAGFGTVTSSPAGIDCGDTCSAQFADGTAVTLTATAAFGWIFAGWGADCSGHGACVLTIDRDRVMQAAFLYDSGPPPPRCHVPNLVGTLLRKAVVRIAHAHCTPGRVIRQRSSKARKNHVLAQSPRPGSSRLPGARINLKVGKGPTKR